MKVALDTGPITSAHSVRGIGAYTKNLLYALRKTALDLETINSTKDKIKADIIHYPYFDLFFDTLKPKIGVKTVVTIHDVIPLVFPTHFPRGIKANFNLHKQKNSLKRVDAIICDSQTSKKDIEKHLKIKPGKIHVVYLAAAEIFKPVKDEKKLSEVSNRFTLPSQFFLYVGDVNWNKNILTMLKAIKRTNVNLVMAGKALNDKSLPQVQEIDKLISDLDIKNNVKKLGFISDYDLVNIYNLALATILPSHYEGFGLPVLESMSCGTPVISAKNSSLEEIGSQAAIFCDANSDEDIAEKIENINQMPSKKLTDLSKRLETHAKRYSWQRVAEETIEVYQSLVKH